MTIHQPSSGMVAQFDRIMLLAKGGKLVYQGTGEETRAHFESLGYSLPPLWVPTDYYLDLIADATTAAKLVEHCPSVEAEETGAMGLGMAALNWKQPTPMWYQVAMHVAPGAAW